MKRTTSILVCTLAAGMAWAQNPQIIENTRAMMNSVQQKSTAASNDALGVKPAPAKQAAVKPASAPAKASTAAVKTTAAPPKAAIVPAKATASTPKPAVVSAKASAPKASAPKASGPSSTPSVAKAASSSPKAAEPFAQKKAPAAAAPKLGVKQLKVAKEIKPAGAQKEKKEKKAVAAAPKAAAPVAAPASSDTASASSSSESTSDDPVKDEQDKKWAMSGKRDPFISPVVSHAGGSGCSTGKKCLEIGAINLRGVVHSDGGFIAVVTNNLNKAYFLRENDPVFDGYVVKITGDSIIFKETVQDRLGKSFTREVTKKITTPAV
ncbi:MAG: hypothetical protein HY010_10490 [Acidobacteria bacterium]|nr:hypothetical protein [Acidobacteriota bacterium]